ncbi:MAG TPA: ATPase, T2SS/T4P/T4SS family, partial [Nitrospira sp.]|nr:ATPase, T2SS/T4P/T4SS family [Nitrospira sp.]
LLISLTIEGGNYRLFRLSTSHHDRVLTALKKMIGLDVAGSGGSQRRSILLRFNKREYKLVMHFHPSPGGECVTIRIIDPRFAGISLDRLELPTDTEAFIKKSLAGTGLVLVTGPFASGKSSTIMAFLRHLAENGERRIISLEELIIEKLPGVKQVQLLNRLANSSMLKSVLRHRPDIVVIDEAFDEETVIEALQAANIDRCLVILCVEAEGIAEAISRLLRMKLDRSQLAEALRFVYTQKVIRKICPDCKSTDTVHADTMRQLQIPTTFRFYTGSGCTACMNTGYHGTATVCEVLRFSPELSEMLENGASGSEVYTEARYGGMTALHEQALNKVIDGTTSLEEVLGIFALPQGFSFKDRLRVGRIGHLRQPDPRQSKHKEALASVFEAEARKQAEPSTIDIFADSGEGKEPEEPIPAEMPEVSGQEPFVERRIEQPQPPATEQLPEQPPESDLMVLLLDDSPVMLQYTQHILESAGIFTVETASSAEEAWDKLQQQYFHLIITDHEMPGQTGQQLIERIRQQPTLNHTGTMLLTGNVKEASALAGGADGYVGKPTDPELLIARAKSIAEIYRRMSMGATARARPATVVDESLPQPQGKAPGHVDFTEQDMNHIASFELDTQRFVVANTPPETDSGG